MPDTNLGTGFTVMKKTKVILNFTEFILWWTRQIMSKKTTACTKLQMNTIKIVKHSNGIQSHPKVKFSHLRPGEMFLRKLQ